MPSVQQSLNNIIETLNFVPTEEKSKCGSSESANQMESSYENESINIPSFVRLKNVDSGAPCFPDIVVIVNTQSFKKEMLISRRTSYQKILAMEKAGLQVVERDIDLPLDLIFNAAVCLIWYEAQNFVDKKATGVEDSFITMFVENIATSTLMSLSYSFSACILVSVIYSSVKFDVQPYLLKIYYFCLFLKYEIADLVLFSFRPGKLINAEITAH